MECLKAILLGIVQGITEWLPISSTGHMILINEFINLGGGKAFVDLFIVVIQFGSILAVLLLYFNKLNPFAKKKNETEKKNTYILWLKVLVGCVPAGIIGVLFSKQIKAIFYNPTVIAITLIVYGIGFLVVENQKKEPTTTKLNQISYLQAFKVGIFQLLALIPGTSRSGATILGGTMIGLSRPIASEYSFFLAVPVMFGASLLDLVRYDGTLTFGLIVILLIGMVVAFIVSVIAIKGLMKFIRSHTFKPFGYYRIGLGILVLVYFVFLPLLK